MNETYCEDQSVEKDGRNVEWLGKLSQMEVRRLELVRRHEQTQQWDKAIGSDGRDPAGRHQGRECYLAGQNRAKENSSEDVDDGDGVLGLAL